MRWSDIITATVAFLVALVSAGCAGGATATDRDTQGHLLVRPNDVTAFGVVQEMMPAGPIENRTNVDPLPLAGWEDGRSVGLTIASPEAGDFVALIYSASYRFATPPAAQTALQDLPDPIEDYGWESTVENDVSVFDDDVRKLLRGRTWHSWHGRDAEDMLTHVFWVQDGAYVAEIHLNVHEESIGRRLLNHLAELALRGELGG